MKVYACKRREARSIRHCWAASVMSMLGSLEMSDTVTEVRNWALAQGVAGHAALVVPLIDEDAVMQAWDSVWDAEWYQVRLGPRHPACDSVRLATYEYWMAAPHADGEGVVLPHGAAWYPPGMPKYVRYTNGCNQEHMRDLARFRCGSHDLAIESGRWAQPQVPRRHRVCKKCTTYSVEDEYHVVMECPATQDVRQRYAPMFGVVGGVESANRATYAQMREFMNQKPPTLSAFIHDCLAQRRTMPDYALYLETDEVDGHQYLVDLFESDG